MTIRRTAARDAARLFVFLVLSVLFLWLSTWLPAWSGEPAAAAFLLRAAMVTCAAMATHLTRRILWPSLDFEAIGRAATAHPIGAGMVFMSISLVVCTLLIISVPQ